ncbi:MAG: 50S ribosomal protein L9 [Coriobacteriia bacterium]|nr:50S ribosomal protein L9 [Coriobacteriia bacterium]
MKVILLTDVKGRGKEGDVIEVARGFATNYLLPRNMAVAATSGNLKQLESRMHNIHMREEAKRLEAEGQAAQIAGKSLVVEVKAGEGGKLFGSVTAGMVADALAAQLGVDVDRRKLDLHGHIKTIGEHEIGVRIYENVTAQILLKVVPEGGVLLAEEPSEAEAVAAIVEEALAAEEAGEAAAAADAEIVGDTDEVAAEDYGVDTDEVAAGDEGVEGEDVPAVDEDEA